MILPSLLWIISFGQLFCQEPLESKQAHAALSNGANMQIPDSTEYDMVNVDFAVEQKLEIISNTEEMQMEAAVADAFFMFPNPSNGAVQVKLFGKVSVYIYNLSGQLIKHYQMSPGNMILDLSELPAGMYQVRAKSDDDYYSGKLLLQ